MLVVASLALAVALPAALRAQEVDCDPGDKEVRSLKFVGNKSIMTSELSAIVLTTPSSFTHLYFGWFFHAGAERCFPDVGLSRDVDNLKLYYLNNGFYDTKVDTIVKPAGPTAVSVIFQINEGAPIRLDTLLITGMDSVQNRVSILRDLQLKVGGRFGQVQLYSDRDSIVARLRNAGYPHADVLQTVHLNRDEHRATAELEVLTGVRARFGTVAVTSIDVDGGPPKIDSTVVRRLLGIKPRQFFSDNAITDASRNLYTLGTYRHVAVDPDTTYPHGDSIADVNVNLREDYMREFDHDEGWSTLDCFRVNASYTDRNFLENAHRIEFTGRLSKLGYGYPTSSSLTRRVCSQLDQDSISSSKVNYYAGATLREPTLFGTNWVPSYSAYTERRGEYREYLRTTYFGLDASATRNMGQGIPFRAGYNLEYAQTDAQPAVLCVVFTRCTEEEQAVIQRALRAAVASASIQRIRIDNPIDPRSGTVVGGEFRFAAPFTGSDPSQSFAKTTFDAAWYHGLTSRVVLAMRVSAGAIFATQLPPPQERLYAGGATSVRGFNQNELGAVIYLLDSTAVQTTKVNDSTFVFQSKPGQPSRRTVPVGGNSLVVGNAELRVRDPFFPNLLQYVFFTDAGQVWSRQAGERNLGFMSLLVTPGIGLRVFSPIGPISVNAGYNPYRNQTGKSFYPTAVDLLLPGKAPLICVTTQGETPLPVVIHKATGEIDQNTAACPSGFTPDQSSGFFSRFRLTLSIGTGF